MQIYSVIVVPGYLVTFLMPRQPAYFHHEHLPRYFSPHRFYVDFLSIPQQRVTSCVMMVVRGKPGDQTYLPANQILLRHHLLSIRSTSVTSNSQVSPWYPSMLNSFKST